MGGPAKPHKGGPGFFKRQNSAWGVPPNPTRGVRGFSNVTRGVRGFSKFFKRHKGGQRVPAQGGVEHDLLFRQRLFHLKIKRGCWSRSSTSKRASGLNVCTMDVYVDDILATVTSEAEWQHVLGTLRGDGSPENMADSLKLKDEGELKMFIGVEINQQEDGSVKISPGYKIGKLEMMLADKLPEKKRPKVPMKAGTMLPKVQAGDPPMTKDEKKYVDSIPFRQVVGSLLHIYCYTRPDIGYAMSQLSRHICDPRPAHCDALLQTVGYLVGTRELGIRYCRGMPRQVDLYCDASLVRGVRRPLSTTTMARKVFPSFLSLFLGP